MIEKLLVVSVLILGLSGVDAAETYRWEDVDGNVHYSDVPPPADARNVVRTRVDGGTPTVSLPYELQEAVSKYPVTLYVTDCGDLCDRARALLVERGIPHTLLDATKPDVRRKLEALPGGQLVVPVAEVGYIVLRGFKKGRWNSALDLAGYPRDAMIAVTPNVPQADDTDVNDTDVNDAGADDADLDSADSDDAESDDADSVGLDPDDADDIDSDDDDPDNFEADDFDADDISSADDEIGYEDDL